MSYQNCGVDATTGNTSGYIKRLSDGKLIKLADGGGYSDDQSDYDTYKSWLDAGNTPSPAD